MKDGGGTGWRLVWGQGHAVLAVWAVLGPHGDGECGCACSDHAEFHCIPHCWNVSENTHVLRRQ